MNCTEFQAAIAAAVERREMPGHDFAAHLDTCHSSDCRDCWLEARLLDRAIREWRRSQPMVDAADEVLSRCWTGMEGDLPVVAPRVVPRQSAVSRSRAIAAIAAAVAVLFSAWVLVPTSHERGDALTVAQQESNGAGDVHRNSASSLPPGAHPAGLVYVEYAQGAARVVTDAVALTFGHQDDMENPTIDPIRIGWEPSWPPVGDDMDAALKDLLESLPSGAPPI